VDLGTAVDAVDLRRGGVAGLGIAVGVVGLGEDGVGRRGGEGVVVIEVVVKKRCAGLWDGVMWSFHEGLGAVCSVQT